MSVFSDYIDDIQHLYKEGKIVADKTKTLVTNIPLIAGGIALGTKIPIVGPAIGRAGKVAFKATKGAGKAILSIPKTSMNKLATGIALVPLTNTVDRVLNTAGTANFITGIISGNLPERDRVKLQRKTFKFSDLLTTHHAKRLTARLFRPSWLKEEEKEGK